MVNICAKPRPPPNAIKCPVHDVYMGDADDLIVKCPVPECAIINLKPNLIKAGLGVYLNSCDKCNWRYPTLEPGICTICEPDMQRRWDEALSSLRGA